jgi:RNA polymerase sigma-70 factor, ECF subfamily
MTAACAVLAPAVAPPEDDALIAAARGGDHVAYTALYQRHAGHVYARLTQLVGPTGDREDLLQQVFLELYRSLPRFRSESSISTFIHGIAVHVALDHLRRRGRRPKDFTTIELDELIDRDPTPEERARRRDELRQVLALLERVKPAKRIAFALVAIAGLSHEEAAELVDTNADVIKQRVLRARRELVAMLARSERAGGAA